MKTLKDVQLTLEWKRLQQRGSSITWCGRFEAARSASLESWYSILSYEKLQPLALGRLCLEVCVANEILYELVSIHTCRVHAMFLSDLFIKQVLYLADGALSIWRLQGSWECVAITRTRAQVPDMSRLGATLSWMRLEAAVARATRMLAVIARIAWVALFKVFLPPGLTWLWATHATIAPFCRCTANGRPLLTRKAAKATAAACNAAATVIIHLGSRYMQLTGLLFTGCWAWQQSGSLKARIPRKKCHAKWQLQNRVVLTVLGIVTLEQVAPWAETCTSELHQVEVCEAQLLEGPASLDLFPDGNSADTWVQLPSVGIGTHLACEDKLWVPFHTVVANLLPRRCLREVSPVEETDLREKDRIDEWYSG